jgi:hypothetical protein
MKPAHAEFAENMVPIKVAGFELGGGGVAAIRHAHGATNAKTAFGKIQAVADGASNAIIRAPHNVIGVHAALHDEVFDQMADFIIHQRRADGRFIAETFAQPARRIIFAAAFPRGKVAGRANPPFSRIQPQHDFAQGNLVVTAARFIANGNGHIVFCSVNKYFKFARI